MIDARARVRCARRSRFRSGRGAAVGARRRRKSVFRRPSAATLEGVVAMLHDQATIASKLLDWGAAVNTTWGLPFVRTSVDHGVAYDAARAARPSTTACCAALRMAHRSLTGGRPRLQRAARADLVVRGAREHNLKDITVSPAARSAGGDHGSERLGQVVARVRHDLRRGAATLRRVAERLRAAVPRADAQARRRRHRRPVAGHQRAPAGHAREIRAPRSAR